ncbi:SAM-dependent methyltransferase, partial [Flavobacteriaceae bacterium]|nr:SAM-dependent methyltransferase [Flavobacteriaceae bacterium]
FLAPKGNVILEAFSKNHPYYQKQNPKVGGPKQPSQLYDIEGIKDDFCDISLQTIKEEIIELSEGSFHLGKTSVIRMQGKK